ncbi:hypothetical protein [Brassicibacter mesophilus]|uniref:hypothetical protein n=1 Tax=Brassicibacter mesophilus TaxID=745119 RepID=UPI003D19B193
MKKLSLVIVVIFIFIILLNGYTVKASFQKDKFNEINQELLQALIMKRAEIMNKGLYNCDNIELVIDELKAIEKDIILENDISVLKEAHSNPTDYPRVTNVRIKDIADIKVEDDMYELIAAIEWDISYNLEDSTEEYEYIIQIDQHDSEYFLIDFRLKNE